MKKRYVFALATSLILGTFGTASLSSCGSSIVASEVKIVVTGTKNGKVGDKIQLKADVYGHSGEKITWESLDIAIATVDQNGLVTLNNPGDALIQASYGNNKEVKSTPVKLTCFGSSEAEKRLVVKTLPNLTHYKTGSKVSYDGIEVVGYDTYDGGTVIDNLSGVEFKKEQLRFSVAEGTELSKAGDLKIRVEADGYAASSFMIKVEDQIIQKIIKIVRVPMKTTYTVSNDKPAKFDSTGLATKLYTYKDNKLVAQKTLENKDIELSIASGTEIVREGNYTVYVSLKSDPTVLKDSFSINVFTENTTIYDLIKRMQSTKNYQVEILNNVGTNNDITGFHYLRTYTENYYDEVEYQNKANPATGQIEFTENVKGHTGYTGYQDPIKGSKYIIGYTEDHLKRIKPTNIVTTGSTDWWSKASSLTSLPTIFNLEHVPTQTKNGRFLTTVIEHEPDDKEGTITIQKYPLIESFLQFCGWSSNLITIMTRFEIAIEEDYKLSMKAFFGSYGITELKVKGIGNCTIPKVENAIKNKTLKPLGKIDAGVLEVASKLRGDYAVRFDYGENGVKTEGVTYFHKDYYYDVLNNVGFASIKNKIYKFKGLYNKVTQKTEFQLESPDPINTQYTDVSGYVSTLIKEGAVIYPKDGLKDVIGTVSSTGELSENTLNTFALYPAFSSPSDKCYQSFDDATKKAFENYLLGGQAIENGRIWFLTHYATNPATGKEEIENIEAWDVNLTTGRGAVAPFGGFSKEAATLDWVEDAVSALIESGQIK